MSQEDFYHYYSFMAEHIEGSIYIYNYPARTGNSISADTIAKLAVRYPNIVGLKDSVQEFSHTGEVLDTVLKVRPDFEVFSGFDDQFPENQQYGGVGGIGALSNIVPEIWSAWIKAAADGDQEGMEKGKWQIDHLMEIYSLESNPQKLLKEILKAEGLDISTYCYFPHNYLREQSLEKALKLIENSRRM